MYLLKDKNPSTNVFSTASVFFHSCSSDENNPQESFWKVKSENTFPPADSTFLTEVAFTCTFKAKNKI